ncbi:hypothetical protein SS50377_25481 [Spironucleus salmonicida]|nr:hypothetical protein SS50377_25481 [Spironucleus salmonicida]
MKIKIYNGDLKIIQQTQLQKLMNISIDTPDIVASKSSGDLFSSQYQQISEWRFDTDVFIPGPQILKNIIITSPYFNLLFKKADKCLYLKSQQLETLIKIDLYEPIYFCIILQQTTQFIALVLTAIRFPGGYYGSQGGITSGHVHVLQFSSECQITEIIVQDKINQKEEIILDTDTNCKQLDVIQKEQILTTRTEFPNDLNKEFFEKAQELLECEQSKESKVLLDNKCSNKISQLYDYFIQELSKDQPNPGVLEQIRLLLQYYDK